MRVRELMNRNLVTIAESSSCHEAVKRMHRARVRHLPVLEEETRVVGVISIGDVVKDIISEQEFMIEQLQNYITGR